MVWTRRGTRDGLLRRARALWPASTIHKHVSPSHRELGETVKSATSGIGCKGESLFWHVPVLEMTTDRPVVDPESEQERTGKSLSRGRPGFRGLNRTARQRQEGFRGSDRD